MSATRKTDALLIYPPLGCWDGLVRDLPLSLLYAAADSVRAGYRVEVLDLRLCARGWRRAVSRRLEGGCAVVGLSVMTGRPIHNALQISRFVREMHPDVPILWGGPHPTVLPEQTLSHPLIDFVIADWGSTPLMLLLDHLCRGEGELDAIAGLGHKRGGVPSFGPPQRRFEVVRPADIPYHLVERDIHRYTRIGSDGVVVPIFTSLGCPHRCAFCIAPGQYSKVSGKKWIPLHVEEVLDHVQLLVDRYGPRELQVYDDDSFVDMERMRTLLRGYVARGFPRRLKLHFRGVRVDELDRMDDDMLALMVQANVHLLFVGIESGSDRVLRAMDKGITREQILRVNRKLARFPRLKPRYSYFCGAPGERYEDLLQTKTLIRQLVRDHPGCYLGAGSDWKPIPGSRLCDEAVREHGLVLPATLEQWSAVDSFDADRISYPWYTPQHDGMIRLMQVFANVADAKLRDFGEAMGPTGALLGALARLYRPLLDFRLEHNLTAWLPEYPVQHQVHNRLGAVLYTLRRRP